EDGVVMRDAGDESAPMRFAQVTHKPAARETGIDLERCGKDSVRERHGRSATALRVWFWDTRAEVAQQLLKLVLLGCLSGVIGFPVLWVSLFSGCNGQRFRDRSRAIRVLLAYYSVGHGVNVFARLAAQFVIR